MPFEGRGSSNYASPCSCNFLQGMSWR